MSLLSLDVGVVLKIWEVYPNIVFGPLSRAFGNSATENNEVMNEVLKRVKGNDGKVTIKENTNKTACVGVPPLYEGDEDRRYNNVVRFPMIAIDRINNPFGIEWMANDPMTRRGRFVVDDKKRLRAFPCTPMYQIDIISDRRVEVDDIWRELVMFLYVKPNVAVKYHNGDKINIEEYPIKLLDTDNTTDVDSFFDKGTVYRQTVSFEVTNVMMLFEGNDKLIETIPIRIVEYDEEGGKEDES